MPTSLSSVTPGVEFPAPESAASVLKTLVRLHLTLPLPNAECQHAMQLRKVLMPAWRVFMMYRVCMADAVLQDGFGGDDGLPEAVTELGNLPLSALAALVLHLRRMRSVDEFAGYAALVSPYEVPHQ
jgi:hypothetical protein